MKKLFVLILSFFVISSYSVAQNVVLPSKAQLRWHDYERTMFIHFGPATWQHREYDNLTTPLSQINPTQLNTDQWCEAAKSWGAKMILFVAKHTGGFCWWNTSTVDYNVMNTPYGRDVMDELSKSCKKYGLDMGVYIYPGDDSFGAPIGSGGITKDPSKQEEYNKVFRQQLTEVLNNYGVMREIWFDGNCKIYIDDILEKHKDNAVIFQGPLATIRWVGNEDGSAPDPNWSTLAAADLKTGVSTALHSTPDGNVYAPVEADVPFLKNGGHKWFWTPDTENLMMTVDQFINLYYKSVGRGSVLLMNSTPDTTGVIPAAHIERYKEFGEAIDKRFASPLVTTKGKGESITITFDVPTEFNHVILQEDLKSGQRVQNYIIESSTDGDRWSMVAEGTSIGNKKIDFFKTVTAKYVRVIFIGSKAQPLIKNFSVFNIDGDMTLLSENEELTKIGAWNKDSYDNSWKEYEIDLTPYVNAIGEYVISFNTITYDFTKESGLEFKDWSVEMYGAKNHSEIVYKDGKFTITRSQQTLDEFKTVFRVMVKSKEGQSVGDIYLRRITF